MDKTLFLVLEQFKEISKPIKDWNLFKKGKISENLEIKNELGWSPLEKFRFDVLKSTKGLVESKKEYFNILYLLKENINIINNIVNESVNEDLPSKIKLDLLRYEKQFESYDFKPFYNIPKNIQRIVLESKDFKLPEFLIEDGEGTSVPMSGGNGVSSIAGVSTQDIADVPSYIGEDDEVKEETPETLNGKRVFKVTQEEFLNFKNGKVNWYWKNHTSNDEIIKYVRKNPSKSFYVKYKNFIFLVKRKDFPQD